MSSSYCLVFHFTLQDFLQLFLLSRTSGNEFLPAFVYLGVSLPLPHFWGTVLLNTGILVEFYSLALQTYDPTTFWPHFWWEILLRILYRHATSLLLLILISWRQVLPDMVFLVDRFFLLELWIHHPITFWPTWLHWEFAERLIQTHLYVIIHFFLAAFKSDFGQFDYNVSWCESPWLTLTGANLLDSACLFLSSVGRFFGHWALCPSLALWNSHNVRVVRLMMPHSPAGAHQFCSLFSFCSSVSRISKTFLHVHWYVFLLPDQDCCWTPLVKFSIQLLYFSAPEYVWLLSIV